MLQRTIASAIVAGIVTSVAATIGVLYVLVFVLGLWWLVAVFIVAFASTFTLDMLTNNVTGGEQGERPEEPSAHR